MKTKTKIAQLQTRAAAQKMAENLTNYSDKCLRNGEYSAPDYQARKLRGQDAYYVRATYHFYAGTYGAPVNGPVSQDVADEMEQWLADRELWAGKK